MDCVRPKGAVHHQRQRPHLGDPLAARRAATVVVRAGKARTVTDEASLQVGDLVEWAKVGPASGGGASGPAPCERSTSLGLVEQADKKIVLLVVDTSSTSEQCVRKATVTARQVSLRVPGGPYTEEHLKVFSAVAAQQAKEAAAQVLAAVPSHEASVGNENAASSPLAAAWELAVADHIKSLTLSELAGLMIDDDSPLSLYRLFRQLACDRLFFRQVSPKGPALVSLEHVTFEPRTPAAVDAIRLQLAAEAAAREDEAAWSLAVRSALAARRRTDQPSPEQWQAGRHARRISALKALATQDVAPLIGETLKLAQASLALAGIVPPSASSTIAASSTGGGNTAAASPLAEAATNLLVDVRAWRRHEPVSALRKGVALGFPEAVEREAQAVLESPPHDSCSSIRVDLTHLRCYTIDDHGTSEVDDGISIEVLDEPLEQQQQKQKQGGSQQDAASAGRVRVWVHVADPTRWLAPGCQLLEEARLRARSLYFPWGNLPMFPRSLSGPFSLRPNQESCALSVGLTLGADGGVRDVTVAPSRVVATHALTYEQADALLCPLPAASVPLAAAVDATAAGELRVLRALADARRGYREGRGCIEIPMPEAKVSVAEMQLDAGRPNVQMKRLSQWDSPSRGMVAEMMILAGEAIGRLGAAEQLPLPYRMQPSPHLPPAAELESLPAGACRGFRLRKCMTRSGVSAVPQPHASLGLDAYVQVTSPIRRWADIVAHLNLKAWLLGVPRPYSAADVEAINQAASSDRMREAGVAERMEEMYWITEYFRQLQSNKSAPHQWLATVLGWQREELRLAAVLIDEYGLEVVVKVDVEVLPGNQVQLALLEARPVAGVLRFYVTDYLSAGAATMAEEDDELQEQLRRAALLEQTAAVAVGESEEGQQHGEAGEGEHASSSSSPVSSGSDFTFVASVVGASSAGEEEEEGRTSRTTRKLAL